MDMNDSFSEIFFIKAEQQLEPEVLNYLDSQSQADVLEQIKLSDISFLDNESNQTFSYFDENNVYLIFPTIYDIGNYFTISFNEIAKIL